MQEGVWVLSLAVIIQSVALIFAVDTLRRQRNLIDRTDEILQREVVEEEYNNQ